MGASPSFWVTMALCSQERTHGNMRASGVHVYNFSIYQWVARLKIHLSKGTNKSPSNAHRYIGDTMILYSSLCANIKWVTNNGNERCNSIRIMDV